jgi:hypothetical protein
MTTKWKFDERQLIIRGQAFLHGFITAIVLLLANAFLLRSGIVWASGFYQNILIMMLTLTVFSVEATLRGVYFGKGERRWMIVGIFLIVALVLWVMGILHVYQGSITFENGGLTRYGSSFIIATLFTIMAVTGIVKEIHERRKERQSNK